MTKNVAAGETASEPVVAKKRASGPRIPRPKFVAIRVTDESGAPVTGVQLEVVATAKDADGAHALINLLNMRKADPAVVAFEYGPYGFKVI